MYKDYCDAAFEWLTEFNPLHPDEMKEIAQDLWEQVILFYI